MLNTASRVSTELSCCAKPPVAEACHRHFEVRVRFDFLRQPRRAVRSQECTQCGLPASPKPCLGSYKPDTRCALGRYALKRGRQAPIFRSRDENPRLSLQGHCSRLGHRGRGQGQRPFHEIGWMDEGRSKALCAALKHAGRTQPVYNMSVKTHAVSVRTIRTSLFLEASEIERAVVLNQDAGA
jgi:hypothetical protein